MIPAPSSRPWLCFHGPRRGGNDALFLSSLRLTEAPKAPAEAGPQDWTPLRPLGIALRTQADLT